MNVSDPVNPVGYRLISVDEQEKITFGDKLANSRPVLVFEYNIKGADKLSYYVTILTNPHPPKIMQDVINPVRIFFETDPTTAIMITESEQQTIKYQNDIVFLTKLRTMGNYNMLNMFR